MAATDAQPFPVKGKALRLTVPILDATGSLVTTGTTNVTISKDAGGFGNPNAGATTATQIATTSGVWYVDLNATDLSCDTLAVKFDNSNGKPTVVVVYPVEVVEPTAIPGFGSGGPGVEETLAIMWALMRNKMTQTATTSTLRNNADNASIGTSTVSDDGTTFTRGEWT